MENIKMELKLVSGTFFNKKMKILNQCIKEISITYISGCGSYEYQNTNSNNVAIKIGNWIELGDQFWK